ncbi:8-amino-7-oxononanoate synthase [Neiella marina]|uniref:8-amino-7-oxononanoate synthase n=1 Tax=Neiella holothuriorum TaxID=2870530 RepID=A0ABS7ED67_9GAMM|nr:8-amino-7-oxononanoate synthase [Neiella holothuriorum]MBW8190258.1 8-amino-7-oxononanoate synthase [Neiella holothuriorum]
MSLLSRIEQQLATQRGAGRWRSVTPRQQGQGRYLVAGNQRWLNFASNDYLGLANHPKVRQAVADAAQQYGVGSGGSALITGYHTLHQALVDRLIELTGKPRVLLFGSGFSANQGVLTSLLQQGDLIVQDKLNHASLIDAGLHSAATSARFRHNDVNSAKRQLSRQASGKLLVTESVFSMDGDKAPLNQLALASQQHDALFMVDDAHGIGVIGEEGLGATSVEPSIDIYMATFGKALGVGGAMIACDQHIADYLTQFCRHYIYTTSLPPALAAGVSAAIDCMAAEPEHRERLLARIEQFRQLAKAAQLPLLASQTAIQPVLVAGAERVTSVAAQLQQAGIACGAIRAPTVKAGDERLRITISASHTEQDIETCVAAVARALETTQEQNQ